MTQPKHPKTTTTPSHAKQQGKPPELSPQSTGAVVSSTPGLPAAPSKLVEDVRTFIDSWSRSLAARHKPKGIFYHYCDAAALINIFRTRRLWATGTRYMNDRTELISLLHNLEQHVQRHGKTPASAALVQMAEVSRVHGASLLADAIGMERFAACFSEDGDLLTQWRAYADNGKGFAIGFNLERLAILQPGSGAAEVRRMKYGATDEASLIDDLFENFTRIVEPYVSQLRTSGWKQGPTTHEWLSLRLNECIMNMTYESKHEAFREEREWRIYPPSAQYLFRASGGRILPYIEVDMTAHDNKDTMPLEKIVMGPRAEPLETERVLTYLASEYGYGHTELDFVRSSAPYR